MNDRLNILLTSVGRRSYLVEYFKEALNGSGEVHVANSSDISPAFRVADRTVVTPIIYDKEYIPFLLRYCKENEIKAVISLFDIDLPVLAENKESFSQIGTKVIVADKWVVDICNDKWESYKFLIKNGFNVPSTFLDLNVALKAIEEEKVTYPLIVKPRWGMGSIAVYEAENEEELRIFYEKTKRNILKTYLKYESLSNIDESVLIQEKLRGQEYGLDVINDLNGKYQTTIVKAKYAMRSGETDCAVTVENTDLKEIGKRLGEIFKHIGNLDVDVFVTESKNYVLEMNARFGGGYPFSHMAGVNLPLAIVKWLMGVKVDESLLIERNNIMSQKDISLVRLYPSYGVTMVQCKNISEIYSAVCALEKQLVPSYTQRGIDLDEYACKLEKFGKVWTLKNVEGNFVGVIAAYMNDVRSGVAYLTMLAITPEYRGLHLAKKLLQHAESKAIKAGMSQFKLEVRKFNTSAIQFYKKYGYLISEEASRDSVYMLKEL